VKRCTLEQYSLYAPLLSRASSERPLIYIVISKSVPVKSTPAFSNESVPLSDVPETVPVRETHNME